LTLETEVEKEEEEKEGQIVSEEEEFEINFEDETVEQLEDEEDVVLTSDGKSETASEDENEFVGDFSNTNCESFVLYRGEAVAYCSLKQVGIHLISPPRAQWLRAVFRRFVGGIRVSVPRFCLTMRLSSVMSLSCHWTVRGLCILIKLSR